LTNRQNNPTMCRITYVGLKESSAVISGAKQSSCTTDWRDLTNMGFKASARIRTLIWCRQQ